MEHTATLYVEDPRLTLTGAANSSSARCAQQTSNDDVFNTISSINILKVWGFRKSTSFPQRHNEQADHNVGQWDHHPLPAPSHFAHMRLALSRIGSDTWWHDIPTTSYTLLGTWGIRNAHNVSST